MVLFNQYFLIFFYLPLYLARGRLPWLNVWSWNFSRFCASSSHISSQCPQFCVSLFQHLLVCYWCQDSGWIWIAQETSASLGSLSLSFLSFSKRWVVLHLCHLVQLSVPMVRLLPALVQLFLIGKADCLLCLIVRHGIEYFARPIRCPQSLCSTKHVVCLTHER